MDSLWMANLYYQSTETVMKAIEKKINNACRREVQVKINNRLDIDRPQ